MDYYRDYLGRLIITEELDSSVLNKLKKIAGVSGNVKVVLSKAAEKEINTIKNASMNGASRGLIVAALANDTNSSISNGVRKYGFSIKSENNINEENYLHNLNFTEKTMIIDYTSACINNGLKAEGFIFECLCVNHFDTKVISAELNDVFNINKGKNSVADLSLNYNSKKLDVQCKWSSGDSINSSTDNFGSPEAKQQLHNIDHFIIMAGNHKKCVIFEANKNAKELISNICTKYVNLNDKEKEKGTWYLSKSIFGKLTREAGNNVVGLTICNGNLNISKKFWSSDHLDDTLLKEITNKDDILSAGTGNDSKKFYFTISEDIKEFNKIKEEVFGNLSGKYDEISDTLGTMTNHMDDKSMKKKDTGLVKKRDERLNIASDENRASFKNELIDKLKEDNKQKIDNFVRMNFKNEEEAKDFKEYLLKELHPNSDNVNVKTATIKKYKQLDSFFNEVLEKYKKKHSSIFNY